MCTGLPYLQAGCCVPQNLEAWMGESNDWAFVVCQGAKAVSHGPVTRNKLAFYLDQGVLRATTLVHRCSDTVAMAKKLSHYVDDWREEYRKYLRKPHLACDC